MFCRGDHGSCITSFSGYLGIMDNTFATIYLGLRLAINKRYPWNFYYSDSQVVIDIVLKDYIIFYSYGTVIANIQDIKKMDWKVTLSFFQGMKF
jgi:hypothetical protein